MAGRGCTIKLQVLEETDGSGIQTMSLPVALHSPLEVLKEQLEEVTGIEFANQVLILLDLTDPERNRDVLLDGRDYMTLAQIGIKNDSTLTLHRLGMPPEIHRKLTKSCFEAKDIQSIPNLITLCTPITAAQANHSYNGIIFDVVAKGPHEVSIHSISVGGMLGLVRVFTRDRPWHDNASENISGHWWAHRASLSRTGWTLVAEQNCTPSWDKPIEVKFNSPLILLPHCKKGVYIHSGLPDDLGIQYQSYLESDIVAEDDHIALLPGLGHTGSQPFDEQNGWYRAHRGLAGAVSYTSHRKGWHPHSHTIFPLELRESVRLMLLCNLKGSSYCSHAMKTTAAATTTMTVNGSSLDISSLPNHVLYYIMEFMHWDWFEGVPLKYYRNQLQSMEDDEDDVNDTLASSSGHGHGQGKARRGELGFFNGADSIARMAFIRHFIESHALDQDMEEHSDDDNIEYDDEEYEEEEEEEDEEYVEMEDVNEEANEIEDVVVAQVDLEEVEGEQEEDEEWEDVCDDSSDDNDDCCVEDVEDQLP